MKHARLFFLFAVLLVLASCGEKDKFTVTGTVTPAGSYGLKAFYYNGTALKEVPVAARDGKFAFEGVAKETAMVDIVASDGRVLCQFLASNGQEVELSINADNPLKSKVKGGDEVNEEWCRWLADNAAVLGKNDPAAVNAIVAKYVRQHASSLLSACLLLTRYDWSCGDGTALLDMIKPQARPENLVEGMRLLASMRTAQAKAATLGSLKVVSRDDSATTWTPSVDGPSMLVLTAGRGAVPDSVAALLRGLSPSSALLVVNLDADTTMQYAAVPGDSAAWRHGWLPSGLGSRGIEGLAVTRLPWLVITAPGGRIVFSGSSVGAARRAWGGM